MRNGVRMKKLKKQIEINRGVGSDKPDYCKSRANPYLLPLLFMFLFTCTALSNPLPKHEIKKINKVADEYALVGKSRTLLFVIRIVEDGSVGREFGVLHPQAMRYKDPEKSFITQAKWAAGTIKKRYTGDLKAFADRWCPTKGDLTKKEKELNKNWYPNAKHWMDKLCKE
jgi:hypothetical protein